jgi:hypothetical protein
MSEQRIDVMLAILAVIKADVEGLGAIKNAHAGNQTVPSVTNSRAKTSTFSPK